MQFTLIRALKIEEILRYNLPTLPTQKYVESHFGAALYSKVIMF